MLAFFLEHFSVKSINLRNWTNKKKIFLRENVLFMSNFKKQDSYATLRNAAV